MDHTVLMAVLILSPLIGFVINGIRYKKPTANLSGGIATTAVAISFISAIILVADLIGMPEEARKIHVSFFQWIAVDKFKIEELDIRADVGAGELARVFTYLASV